MPNFCCFSNCSYDRTAGEDQVNWCEWWGATIRQCTTTLSCDSIAECATRNQRLPTHVPRRRQRQYTAIQSRIWWVLNIKNIIRHPIQKKIKFSLKTSFGQTPWSLLVIHPSDVEDTDVHVCPWYRPLSHDDLVLWNSSSNGYCPFSRLSPWCPMGGVACLTPISNPFSSDQD